MRLMAPVKVSNMPVKLEVRHVPRLVQRLESRAQKLAQMLGDPTTPPVLLEKQRVLVMDATADLLSVRTPDEEVR